MKARRQAGIAFLAALASLLPQIVAGALYLNPDDWERLRLSRQAMTPPPPVAGDLALVADGDGDALDDAAIRIMERGPSALPDVHAALLDPDFTDRRKPILLLVISVIADASSASPVLQFGRARPETHDRLLECLRRLQGAAPDADAFALARVADPDADPWVRQMAMIYLADRGLPEAAAWADRFRADPSPDFQAVALYADAAVNRPGTQAALVQLINSGTSLELRWPLYVSLSRLAAPEAFDAELRIEVHDSMRFKKARKLAELRLLSGQARTDLAIDLLTFDDPEIRILALRDIIARGDQRQLAPYAHAGVPPRLRVWVRRELRLADYQVIEGATVRIVPAVP